MSKISFRKFATIGATVALSLQLFAGATLAAPPNWVMSVENLAPTVKPGNNAAFAVTIRNNGPSNISALFLTSNVASPAAFVDGDRSEKCVLGPVLLCSFGPVNAGTELRLRVAYQTPANARSTFDVEFQLNTTGNTSSDKRGNSRGDTLKKTASTTLDGSANFGGGWIIGDTLVSNSTQLGNSNRQSTQVDAPVSLINVTVLDGITENQCISNCGGGTQLGEWSRINVDNGKEFASAFKVTLTLRGQNLPNPKPSADLITVLHVDDAGAGTLITDRCNSASAPTNVPTSGCVYASYVGQNLQVVVWLYSNGGIKTRL